MTARRTLLLLAGVGAAAGVAGFYAGRMLAPSAPPLVPAAEEPPLPEEVTLSPEALRNFGLQTATAERRPVVRRLRVTGSVGFNELRIAHINPLARGRVQAVEVSIGQRVKSGQRLAVLDALDLADARRQLANAEAALHQAEAETRTTRAALQRAQGLVRSGALAQSEVERRRAELARAEAAVQTQQVEAGHWREMLSRYSPAGTGEMAGVSLAGLVPADARGAILAPFDGAVLSIAATPGELVDTNREILTLVDPSTMWVQADLPERELAAVRPGAAVAITVEAWPGRRFQGRVAYVADQLERSTGTARLRCEVENPDGALKANMFAIAEIEAPLGREGIMVPEAALQSVDGQPLVFLRLEETRFVRRAVRPGQRQGEWTEVLEGLEPGEVVVAEGSFRLKSLLLRSRVPAED